MMQEKESQMKVIFREGKRIYLRPLEKNDAKICQVWFNDEEVQRYLLGAKPLNLSQEESFIESIGTDDRKIVFGIVMKENDQIIGTVGLHGINYFFRSAELGISIGEKNYWNNGYGREAINLVLIYCFGTLNLHRVGLDVLSTNKRAFRCYQSCGFKKEGVEKESVFRDGKYENVINMAILRKDFSG